MSAEDRLFEEIHLYRDDPLGYVKYAFPWGEKGTLFKMKREQIIGKLKSVKLRRKNGLDWLEPKPYLARFPQRPTAFLDKKIFVSHCFYWWAILELNQ